MRVYGRGIRRRPASMFDGDPALLGLAHSIVFALPGTPVLRYGDEIGMGEDLALPEREALRTPVQWSDTTNAGFSDTAPQHLVAPVIREGPFGHPEVNASDPLSQPGSPLNRVATMARVRSMLQEIGSGEVRAIDVGRDCVLALWHEVAGSQVVTLHNLAPEPVRADLTGEGFGPMIDLVSDAPYPRLTAPLETVPLNGYGYRWLRDANSVLASPKENLTVATTIPPRPGSRDRGPRPK